MKKNFLIIGAPETGKTALFRLIMESKKNYVYLYGKTGASPWLFSECKEDTKYLIIDDVSENSLEFYMSLIDGVLVNSPRDIPFMIYPTIIINTNCNINITESIKQQFFIIETK